ncbi:UNVERIFIED_CONTAM: hypothetical protein BJ099_118129 [Lysinibacillus xylanilyticus]
MIENRLYWTNYPIQKGAFSMTENNHSEVPKKNKPARGSETAA